MLLQKASGKKKIKKKKRTNDCSRQMQANIVYNVEYKRSF